MVARRHMREAAMHPITDKAEVAIDFPDKFYRGSFGRDCSFEARAEPDGVLIRLVRPGEDRRAAEIHLHHFLLASILEDLARSFAECEPIDAVHGEPLRRAAQAFAQALDRNCGMAGSAG
jgi:hypothetical protein